MNFSLSEEHRMAREAARDFAQTELRPKSVFLFYNR